MLLRLFIATLRSPAGKGLTYWHSFVMFNCVFVTFPCGVLGQVWYLIVSIPDLCQLSYFACLGSYVVVFFYIKTCFAIMKAQLPYAIHNHRETIKSN